MNFVFCLNVNNVFIEIKYFLMIIYCYYYLFSRTLTWVYDAILDDLVFPAEIVGKRIRVKTDGKQIMKVHLDKTQQTNIEHKVF